MMCPGRTITIGVSSCLLGQAVRYDGGHKHERCITETLGRYFAFAPFCPEMGAGLGAPRPAMHLVRQAGEIRAVVSKQPDIDHTEALAGFFDAIRARLQAVDGYILKSNSPSCGMKQVKVYIPGQEQLPPTLDGAGVFASRLQAAFPLLPIAEEVHLRNPALRASFVARVFAHHCRRRLQAEKMSPVVEASPD
ncbi:DUF523 domain-containing protein [Candidatus Thiothrix sp. Deng01]|uniref:DUF523 domain-containing protein n=1 Tax=Candidatus Thiothrix phosphatis TaxID=3112415 RepID=A0ABU6CTA9_9GAMM|nr:DUF523 domain-containing protein [Candidatus Thiothrix sp. Deng01]MEB4589643.1 DUF523 domain-containing protein [Candidatus Thiothrix sp. Deng01]